MAVVKKEVDVAKEAGDVMDFVVAVVKHFKEGKGLSEATELLDELMTAVSGIDEVDDEWEVVEDKKWLPWVIFVGFVLFGLIVLF